MTLHEIYDTHIDGGEGLLAIIIFERTERSPFGARFFTPNDSQLQVGIIKREQGYEVPRHIHLPLSRDTLEGTPEVLIVKQGKIRVRVYNSQQEEVEDAVLSQDGIIILLKGGHSVEFLESSTLIEVKQGPYTSRDKDKRGF